MLQFALGDDDDAAGDMFQEARGSDECTVQAELMIGYINEFSGDIPAATERFDTALRLAPAVVHENFYDRAYEHTDPTLDHSIYSNRLRKLVAFRDRFERLFSGHEAAAGHDGRLGFLPSRSPVPGSSSDRVDINAGTVNLTTARHILAEHEFIVVHSFLTQWEVCQLQGFYSDLIDRRIIDNFDETLSRTVTYNDRLSHWLGQRMTKVMNDIADQPIKHVYSFLCWHKSVAGAPRPILKPHTDREDNDFTVSIQMHYDDSLGDSSWPIWVHALRQEDARAGWQDEPPRSESMKLNLGDGDAVIFRGRHHIHWRDPMPDTGRSFSSLLLHFVPTRFDWYEFKFIRQKIDPTI